MNILNEVELPLETLLCNSDVNNLQTNIQHDEGIIAMKETLTTS